MYADGTDPCLIEDYIPGTKSIRFTDLAPTYTNAVMQDKILQAYSSVRESTVRHLNIVPGARERRHWRSEAGASLPCVRGWPLHPLHGTARAQGRSGRRRRLHGVAGRAARGLRALRLARRLVSPPRRRANVMLLVSPPRS